MTKETTKNSQYVRFDWAIKRILRDQANKKVLEGLISVLVKDSVTITEIMESENNKLSDEDKGNRVDVKAKTSNGEIIIVEVQLTKESDFFQRILFGTTTAINDQIGIGQDYSIIKKVYSINILYFNFGEGDDFAYHGYMDFHGMTKEGSVLRFNTENERKYMRSSMVTPPERVFPEYFLLRVNQFNEVARTPIEEWMAYLKDGIISDDTSVPGLQEARSKLDVMKMTKDEYNAYRAYMVSVHAAEDAFNTAKADGWNAGWEEGIAEGKAQGIAEGKAQGIAEGKAQGIAEGKAQGIAEGAESMKIDIARRMLTNHFDITQIRKMTGLSDDEIAALS